MNRIIVEVSNYVKKLFETNPSFFRYHNFYHTKEVVDIVEDLAENSVISEGDRELLLIAAWFHDIGYPETIPYHEEKSAEKAEEFLSEKNYPPDKIAAVKKLILSTKVPQSPENILEQIMCDADIAYIGKKDFMGRINQLREEWGNTLQKEFSDADWYNTNIHFLESNSFHTEYAKTRFGQTRKENLAELRKLLEKEKTNHNSK